MNEGVSIIIPLYNKEKYIFQCLESIQNQKYKLFEVLIIDDGSIDNSKDICIFFCNKDKRFKYYKKENGGVSSARNYGLSLTSYNYVVFVDADDYIEREYLQSLITNKHDLVVEGFKKLQNETLSEFHIPNNLYDKNEILELLMNKEITNIFSVPYLKLFNMKYINEKKLRFNEKLNFGEDFDFVLNYLDLIPENTNVKLVDGCYYINRIEEGTLSRRELPNIWEQLSMVYISVKKVYEDNYKALYFFLLRFIKVSLLNKYCVKYTNFKKVFNNIRHNKEFNELKLTNIKFFSIDWIICFLIKKNFIFASYVIFSLKRGGKIY